MSGDGTNIDLFGVSVSLWLENNGNMVPFRSIAGNSTDYIESISVKLGLMETFQLEIKICPPLADAVNLLNSGKIGLGFASKNKTSHVKTATPVGSDVNVGDKSYSMNKIAVKISYGGLSSPVFKAILLTPELSLNEEGIDITMKGIGMLFEKTKKPALMKGINIPSEVIQYLLGHEQGLNVVFDKKAKAILESANPIAVPSSRNSFEEAKRILMENNCTLYFVGANGINEKQTVRIAHTQDRRQKNNTFCSFVAFRNIDPNNRVYPILNLSAEVTNLAVSSMLVGAKTAIADKSTKTTTQKNADGGHYTGNVSASVTTQDGSIAGASDPSKRNSTGESTGVDTNEKTGFLTGGIAREGGDIFKTIQGVVSDYMDKAFAYNLTSVCIPDLLPARMVNVAIANIHALTNSYDLITVEHNISNGGAETRISVNAMGGIVSAIGQNGNKVAGKVAEAAGGLFGSPGSTKTKTVKGINQ